MFSKSTIVAICGSDSSGKESQTKLLASRLRDEGFNVKLIEVPIKSRFTYPIIYWMLFNGLAKRFPTLFQTIQVLNKLVFQTFYLTWYRFRYSYIIFDRWALSALVYGNVSGVNRHLNKFFYNLLIEPDVTLILTGRSYKRAKKNDSYEADQQFQKKVSEEYVGWGSQNRNTYLISNHGSKSEVHELIWETLDKHGVL